MQWSLWTEVLYSRIYLKSQWLTMMRRLRTLEGRGQALLLLRRILSRQRKRFSPEEVELKTYPLWVSPLSWVGVLNCIKWRKELGSSMLLFTVNLFLLHLFRCVCVCACLLHVSVGTSACECRWRSEDSLSCQWSYVGHCSGTCFLIALKISK